MLTNNIKFLNYLKVDKKKLNLQLKKIKKENILGKYKLLNKHDFKIIVCAGIRKGP